MYTFLIIAMSALAVLLCVVILLQAGKGGGLAATFGGASSSTESFMGGRQAATLLTKLSWVGGGVFLFIALVLSVLSSRQPQGAESILQQEAESFQTVPSEPASVLESEAGRREGGSPAPGEEGGELPLQREDGTRP